MLRSRSLLAALLLLAAAAPFLLAPAHARAADTVKMTFKVQVTGIHVVDWVDKPSIAGERCKAWSTGSGTQTTGFSTKRPITYTGMKVVGKLPKVMRSMPRLTLLGFGKTSDFRATVERKGTWQDHVVPPTRECTPCGPLSEYGECGTEQQPPPRALQCGRRDVKAAGANLLYVAKGDDSAGAVALTDALRVDLSASSDGLFPNCAPELEDGGGRDLHTPDFAEVSFVGSKAKRLANMKVGQKIRLNDSQEAGFVSEDSVPSRELDTCSDATLQGFGYRECAVTDVTVEVRRVR